MQKNILNISLLLALTLLTLMPAHASLFRGETVFGAARFDFLYNDVTKRFNNFELSFTHDHGGTTDEHTYVLTTEDDNGNELYGESLFLILKNGLNGPTTLGHFNVAGTTVYIGKVGASFITYSSYSCRGEKGVYDYQIALCVDGSALFYHQGGVGRVTTIETLAATDNPQTITFNPLPDKAWNAGDFDVSATSDSSLTVTFVNYSPATEVVQEFTITQATQSIDFSPLATKFSGDTGFNLNATASSTLPVIFASSTSPVCTVSGNSVVLVSLGRCSITASQSGNGSYFAANDVMRSFIVSDQVDTDKDGVSDATETLEGTDANDANFTALNRSLTPLWALSTSYNSGGLVPANLINEVGLSTDEFAKYATHDGVLANHWGTGSIDGGLSGPTHIESGAALAALDGQAVVFDLGSARTIDGAFVWNYAQDWQPATH